MKFRTISRNLPVVILSVLAILMAQSKSLESSPGQTQSPMQPGSTPGAGQRRGGCAKQAGIPQNVIEQRRTLRENALQQIRSVCSDSSLSEQQRMEKIKEIHQSIRQQAAALISPQQEEALKQCEGQRRGGQGGARGGMHAGGMHAGGGRQGNPCDEAMMAGPQK